MPLWRFHVRRALLIRFFDDAFNESSARCMQLGDTAHTFVHAACGQAVVYVGLEIREAALDPLDELELREAFTGLKAVQEDIV